MDSKHLLKIPDEVDVVQAAPILCAGEQKCLSCPLFCSNLKTELSQHETTGTTAYRALRQMDLRPSQWVAVVGAGGGLGHLYVLLLHYCCSKANLLQGLCNMQRHLACLCSQSMPVPKKEIYAET